MSTNMIRFDERPQQGQTYTIRPQWPIEGEPYRAQLVRLVERDGHGLASFVLQDGDAMEDVPVIWEVTSVFENLDGAEQRRHDA